ncbi:MAG TPA: ABC transporter substrate-binding protein [Capsulimonadaceae bacterium]|nr:ABC transporter substrate-binding protein [Capsulimonadaceae bacterium]
MKKSNWKNWVAVAVIIVAIAAIAYEHLKPAPHTRQTLDVAFVPVTCHLTCPVTDFASKTTTTGTEFNAVRFTAFPPIVEAMKAKRLEAAFLTVPLAMQLREQGAPIKICCLGHRNGSAIVIQAGDTAKSLADMKGKIIAIPSPYSNESILLHMLMQKQGLKPGDIKIIKLGPPDMPTALAAKTIDGFVVAEPFVSAAVKNGTGRILYDANDIWPNYISCCLAVNEDLINKHPEIVKDLVRGIVDSGAWADDHRRDAAKLAAPYFRQDLGLLTYVLTQKRDPISYRMLTPGDAEMQRIEDMGMAQGLFHKKIPMSDLMDKSFIPVDVQPAVIDTSKLGTIPKS